ncbi:MAG: MFS transporter [Pseudomonadota bacterium]
MIARPPNWSIVPFALILLGGSGTGGPVWIGHVGAAVAFLLVGAGMHTTQTAGLALATDLAPPDARPRVVALLYVMLLVGMVVSSLVFGLLLADYSHMALVRCVQGAAVVTFAVNLIALWKQEPRAPQRTGLDRPRVAFGEAWGRLREKGRVTRMLVALGIGTAAFNMQDVLLEPYGAEVLGLSVSGTTTLTAIFSAGMLLGFAYAAQHLARSSDAAFGKISANHAADGGAAHAAARALGEAVGRARPYRLAGKGCLVGLVAFAAVIFAGPLESPGLFRVGAGLIGVGSGLFSVAMLVAAMALARSEDTGIVIGAWGAVQATSAGVAIALGGILRDAASAAGVSGALGPAFTDHAIGYSVVYHLEIGLLFVALVALGPVLGYIQNSTAETAPADDGFGLTHFPG